jgi:hypothetical protein
MKKGQPHGYHATVAHLAKVLKALPPQGGGVSPRSEMIALVSFIFGKPVPQVEADLLRCQSKP